MKTIPNQPLDLKTKNAEKNKCSICALKKRPHKKKKPVCDHSTKDKNYFSYVKENGYNFGKDFITPETMELCTNCNMWHTELNIESFIWFLRESEGLTISPSDKHHKEKFLECDCQYGRGIPKYYLTPDGPRRKKCVSRIFKDFKSQNPSLKKEELIKAFLGSQ